MQQGATADTETLRPAALIPCEPAEAPAWDHMFGRAQELSCAMLRGAGETFSQPHPPCNRISHQVVLRAWMRDLRREITNTCSSLPGIAGKSKLHKADICHSDSTQIVDYCFD